METCRATFDVGFILDSSYSLLEDYQKEKDFVKQCAGKFGISKNGTHAAMIDFSLYAYLAVKLSYYTDIPSFNNAVDSIPLIGYMTRIDLAMNVANKEMFSHENGGRDDASKVLILITDGTQSDDDDVTDPAAIAAEIRGRGIETFVVGVGDAINETELLSIAGRSEHLFTADSFDDLIGSRVAEHIVNAACALDSDEFTYYGKYNIIFFVFALLAYFVQLGPKLGVLCSNWQWKTVHGLVASLNQYAVLVSTKLMW